MFIFISTKYLSFIKVSSFNGEEKKELRIICKKSKTKRFVESKIRAEGKKWRWRQTGM